MFCCIMLQICKEIRSNSYKLIDVGQFCNIYFCKVELRMQLFQRIASNTNEIKTQKILEHRGCSVNIVWFSTIIKLCILRLVLNWLKADLKYSENPDGVIFFSPSEVNILVDHNLLIKNWQRK